MTVTAVLAARSRAGSPASSDPFVFAGRPLRAGRALESTSRFSDDVWDLSPAMLKKHERRFILDFRMIPASHRETGKELCYAMLGGKSASHSSPPSTAAPPSTAGG